VYVEFAVPERYLADLQKAAKQPKTTVELTASAADGASLVRTGPLTFLDNAVDSPTGTVRLRATVENKDRALWPGQYTRVKIHVPADAPVLAVPASSVNQGPEGAYVYVLAAGDVAEQRPVTVARTDAEHAVVTTGVKAGELIIVDGQSRVIPGARVTRLDAKPAAQATP
jgi:multidrug efflux system membrane fusion protein